MNVKVIQMLDEEGRNVLRMNRRNGRILARWRNDMPGQRGYQWVRERKAVEQGYGELAYQAIRVALYMNGLSDFCPSMHCPELGIRITYVID